MGSLTSANVSSISLVKPVMSIYLLSRDTAVKQQSSESLTFLSYETGSNNSSIDFSMPIDWN